MDWVLFKFRGGYTKHVFIKLILEWILNNELNENWKPLEEWN